MKRDQVIQSYREPNTEISVTRTADGAPPTEIEFGAEFCALGKHHSYHFGYEYNSDTRILAIAPLDATLEDALKNGTILSFGCNAARDQGYERTILIERCLLGGKPLAEAIEISAAIPDYGAPETHLGDGRGEPQRQPSPIPGIAMTKI